MRIHVHLRLLVPALFVMASMVVPVRPAAARSMPAAGVSGDFWVDAQAGNDANNGLSSTSAFKTIQAAARIAGPGSTIHILPGVYRELVTPAYDGTGTARITYKAQNGPGTVKLRGSAPSSSLTWTRLVSNTIGLPAGVNPGNLYYADLSGWGLTEAPRFVAQLNAQGDVTSRLPLAREPDWQVATAWKYGEYWWAADGGSSAATCDPSTNQNRDCDSASRSTTQLTDRTNDSQAGVQAGNLTTLGNLTGATLVALDDNTGHYIYRRKIVAHNVAAGTVTVDQLCEFDRGSGKPGLGWGSKYYVEDRPALLDQPGEWWYDASTSRFYLWPLTAVNPATLSIEISRRDTGIQLSMRSYITIDGLTLEFFNDRAVAENNGSNYKSYSNIIRNATLRYADVGIDLSQGTDGAITNVTDGFTLESSVIAHIDSQAIDTGYYWSGGTADTFTRAGVINTVIRNNEMYDLAFRNDADNADGMNFGYPDKLRFEGNYVHDVAHNGMILGRSIVQSSKERDFSPSEIKIGEILIKDNIIEKACMLAADCGALKMEGGGADNAVHREVLVTGNVFRNNIGWTWISQKRGRWAGGPGSDVQGMGGFGLYLDHASGLHAYRNISYNNAWADIDIYTNWWDGDIVLYNNIAANSLAGIYLGGSAESSSNTQIANNIILNNENYGIRFYQPPNGYGNFVLDYNLYYNNGWRTEQAGGTYNPGDMVLYSPNQYYPTVAAIRAGTPWEDHGVEGDPAFATYNLSDHNLFDGSWPDFRLTTASANAIDRGTPDIPSSLSALLTKFNVAYPRVGSAFDIGRYESATPAETNSSVAIGGSLMGSYAIPSGGVATLQYPVLNGPVQITSTKDGALFTSERVQNARGFVNELMGYPIDEVTNEYWFPWYDNLSMQTWILVGNPSSSSPAHVHIYIAGADMNPSGYEIPAGGRITPTYPVLNGPVHIVSDINVFTSERVHTGQGFVQETMGMPQNQLTTQYWFPWYDNKSMTSWILIGNPSTTADAHVDISIAGSLMDHYTIPPGGRITPQYDILNGPVQVTSDIEVFTSERVHNGAGFIQETMGVPANRLTTEYWFPWYDNKNSTSWILVGNPSATADAHVTLYIAGASVGSQTIAPQGRWTPQFNIVNGPVHVVSDLNVFTSERVHTGQGFVQETMGIPSDQLTTEYWFPWYDNLTMSSSVLVARP